MKKVGIPLLFFFCVCVGRADTLSTSFVDVMVTGVPLGSPYPIGGANGKGIRLKNSGNSPIWVNIRAIVPTPDELRDGAKAIEDPSWIQFQPAEIQIPAHKEVECKVIVEIPKMRKFRNSYYQSMIWIRSEPRGAGGVQVRAGLKTRLRFKTTK